MIHIDTEHTSPAPPSRGTQKNDRLSRLVSAYKVRAHSSLPLSTHTDTPLLIPHSPFVYTYTHTSVYPHTYLSTYIKLVAHFAILSLSSRKPETLSLVSLRHRAYIYTRTLALITFFHVCSRERGNPILTEKETPHAGESRSRIARVIYICVCMQSARGV